MLRPTLNPLRLELTSPPTLFRVSRLELTSPPTLFLSITSGVSQASTGVVVSSTTSVELQAVNVTIITITIAVSSPSQVNLTALTDAILDFLGLPLSDSYRIVIQFSLKRDVSVNFYIAPSSNPDDTSSDNLTNTLFSALSSSNTTLQGFPTTNAPQREVQTVFIPVVAATTAQMTSGMGMASITSGMGMASMTSGMASMTSGMTPSMTTGMVNSLTTSPSLTTDVEAEPLMSSSGLTTSDKVAIGILVPVGVIIIVIVIAFAAFRGRNRNNEDVEAGIEMRPQQPKKEAPATKKPDAQESKKTELSSSSESSSSETESSETASQSSKSSASSKSSKSKDSKASSSGSDSDSDSSKSD